MSITGENNELRNMKIVMHENLRVAIDMLLAYVQNRDRECYFQVLLLKAESLKLTDPSAKADITNVLKSIIEKLEMGNFDKTIEFDPHLFSAIFDKVVNNGIQRDVLLKCQGIKRSYKRSKFKLEVDKFALQSGDIIGLVGENGNGKSTFLKILAGELAPDSGTISYFGAKEKIRGGEWAMFKKKVAYLPQEIKGINGKVIDSIRLYASLHGIRGKENDYEVDYIISRLGLENWKNAKWNELSGGYKLKMALARLLVCKPKVILLDEPLAYLDINAKSVLLTDLKSLSKSIDNPVSIIISSQNLEEVEAVADKMVVISNGKFTYNDVTANIGNSRTENTFEIQSSLSFSELESRLIRFNYTRIENMGHSVMITTPLNISLNNLMQYCINESIPVKMLYDMSNSTKKLLLHPRSAA